MIPEWRFTPGLFKQRGKYEGKRSFNCMGSGFNDLTWADDYQMTGGAAYAHVRKMSPDQAKTYLFITAVHLIVRDGVDPIAVHNAFFNINEYRDGLATDFCHKL